MIEDASTWMLLNLGIGPDTQGKIASSFLTLLILWLLHQFVLRALIFRINDLRLRYQWQKTLGYLMVAAGFFLIWPIWFQGVRSLATYLGLLSAGLAVALKDPITDMIGWAFILWRRTFEVGDRIEIAEYAGDVIDIRLFQFTLMEIGNWVDAEQSTGRILHIPNGLVFTSVLANYTKGSDFIWNELPVLVTFESDWKKAKQILVEIAERNTKGRSEEAEQSFRMAARRYMLQYGSLTSTVYTSVKDSGVMLTIRYLCEPRRRRDSSQAIWEDILVEFARHTDIDFAYSTMRYYRNDTEGKQAISPNLP